MEMISFSECPICRASGAKTLHSLNCGNMDNSNLYPIVRLMSCSRCGHVFNGLSPDELEGLNHYYNAEYAPANLEAVNMKGDRPGSADSLTVDRYSHLYNALESHICQHSEILDVGCAMGGFLDYLKQKGFDRLSGVEMTDVYVECAQKKTQYRIEHGNAESLPFADSTFDVVVMEQVMEHLANPVKAFQETRRVLKNGGIFCIGLPDASRYADFYFFDFYWLLLREHIQHFDIEHLNFVAGNEGFQILSHYQTAHSVMSDRMVMPNLCAVYRLSDSPSHKSSKKIDLCKLEQQIIGYVAQEKVKQSSKSNKIGELSKSCRPVYIWGIGREFFYLYESAGLKYCNIAGLIDANQFKQKSCTVNGMKPTAGNDLLLKAPVNSILLISAIAHSEEIKNIVRTMGFKGEILCADVNGELT